MAALTLSITSLPSQAELQSFARAAALLLTERHPRTLGARIVKRKAGVGVQHLDHRDYVPGDEVRHIDWRQTARRRRPTVRQFESESSSDWIVLLDASSSMAIHQASKWRAAAGAGAAMSYALLELGHRVGLLAFGGRVLAECPRGRGQSHYATIVRTLRELRPAPAGQGSDLGACARRMHGAASVFAVGDFLPADQMCRGLGEILQRCTSLHALQVTDASETDLSTTGEVELVDVETGATIPAHADSATTAAAERERAEMTRRLRIYCRRSGIAFTTWDAARPWQPALIHHLLQARSAC